MTLPPAGTPVESVNTSISVHEVTHSAEGVSVTSTTCGMWQPEITGVQTVFSEAFVAAIPAWTSNITVSTNSDGAPRFRLATQPLIFGADLPDPATSPLPTKGDDPSVVDVDKDGNPGVTVSWWGSSPARSTSSSGALVTSMGSLSPHRTHEGHLLGEVEQQVVGASEPELMLLDLSPTKHPDPDRSVFARTSRRQRDLRELDGRG